MKKLIGTNASPGIAFGKVLKIVQESIEVEEKQCTKVEEEIIKVEKAVDKAKKDLDRIMNKVEVEIGRDESEIFASHIMILQDPEMLTSVSELIKSKGINGEYAFKSISENYINMFLNMDNEYMKERARDIKDVRDRVLRYMLGLKVVDLASLKDEVILVAEDLTPSQTAIMDKSKVLGFLTDIGGKTSHSAIMARTLGIPAITGLGDISKQLEDGEIVAFNGEDGQVYINPDKEKLIEFKVLKDKFHEEIRELNKYKGRASITLDGKKVEIACNIGTPKDVEKVIENDGEGIGLYRTEFLYMDRNTFPTEEEQFQAYKEVLMKMKGSPVVIRTLDVGGDKELEYLKLPKEMNPFLGYRAIRVCLERKDIFKAQLRALLRASVYGELKIMFPMISCVEEIRKAKDILQECRDELKNEGVEYRQVQVGIMIEVPSAAISSDILAKEVDFFSIGTNDLTQYTTAVDRMNEKIHDLYDTFNPGVIRLIDMVIKNAHKENIWVGMCGEAAADELMIPILIGLGLDEFSMSAGSVLKSRARISEISYEKSKELTDKVLTLGTSKEIKDLVQNFWEKN